MIRLLIADDHAIVREGLKKIFALTSDIKPVAEASNSDEVMHLVKNETLFDLILMDLTMPGASGMDLIQKIKEHQATLPILVFSMHNEPQVALGAVTAGADGYIAKDCNPEILLEAIRKVAEGGNYIDPYLAEKLAYQTAFSAQLAPHKLLSERELEVFGLLVRGYPIIKIAEQLALSSKTVSSHKLKLLAKLKIKSVPDLVRYSMHHNLFR